MAATELITEIYDNQLRGMEYVHSCTTERTQGTGVYTLTYMNHLELINLNFILKTPAAQGPWAITTHGEKGARSRMLPLYDGPGGEGPTTDT